MSRWLVSWILMCLVGALAVLPGRAAEIAFENALEADGVVYGQVSGILDAKTSADGLTEWTLKDVRFQPKSTPGASVVWNAQNGSGSGSAASGSRTTLKVFDITLEQSSGVDVAYRFRLTGGVETGSIKDITLELVP